MTITPELNNLNDRILALLDNFKSDTGLIVHKITIEDRLVTFEIWTVGEQIKVNVYTYVN